MPAPAPSLHWLPVEPAWRERLRRLSTGAAGADAWHEVTALARTRLDFTAINALDRVAGQTLGDRPPAALGTTPVRLAILGSSTTQHLHPAIRVGGLRRELWIELYEPAYGQYLQELLDPASGLHRFAPTAILFALDAHHLAAGFDAAMDAPQAAAAFEQLTCRLAECWRLAGAAFGAHLIQQTALDVFVPVLGENEHRLEGSRSETIRRFNGWAREAAGRSDVDLLAIDRRAARDGLDAWFNPAHWHRAKQEIAAPAAPVYGEVVARLLAARQGLSSKCLVLDLDNTLWGGVIGDDGPEGIVLGQGSAAGEGFVAVQEHARELARRGVILAVNSKNDEANALAAFDSHPEMVLRRSDIACFVANWQDKAGNLRHIAHQLEIGLDALVFLDDNPAERALIRQELPMVAVPEVPEDPALVPGALADAGYFEGLGVTEEDRGRAAAYQGNLQRKSLQASTTDMAAFLRGLEMELVWRRFDPVGLARIVQLINKTNQFNLTTRRTTQPEIEALMADPRQVGLQLRLLDRFGDNGIIAILTGTMEGTDLSIETWLMSCRVLGRQVEQATLNLLIDVASAMGARRLVGVYRPSAKNAMVREHYAKLGFTLLRQDDDGGSRSVLELGAARPAPTFIAMREG